MSSGRDATLSTRWSRPASCAVVLGGLYVYVLLVVDPRLLLHSHSPAFFLRWQDFQSALAWPGGLMEYLAAGLSQTYGSAALGALVITIAVSLVWGSAHLLLKLCPSPSPAWLSFVPVVLLLVLLNRYTLPVVAILSIAAALFLSRVYAALPFRRGMVRALIGLGLCGGFYAAAGAASILLAFLCVLVEWRVRRSAAAGTILLIGGAAIPYMAAGWVYHVSAWDAYLRLTALEYDWYPPVTSIVLYAALPLSMILGMVWPARRVDQRRSEPRRKAPPCAENVAGRGPETRLAWCPRTALFLLAGALAAGLSYDPHRRAVLAVDFHARHRQWDQALAAADPLKWAGAVPGRRLDERLAATCFSFHFPTGAVTPAPLLPTWNVAIHDINFALARKGQLLDRMFQYPQRMGASVVRLLPDDEGAYVAHSYNPDILLELGHVNEAERVACESLANVGPRPWLLERLFVINVLKDRPQAARTCLNIMAADPARRASTEALRRQLDQDPTFSRHPGVQQVRSRMYRTDHVGRVDNMDPEEEMLRYLLVANPHNRLAFDYLTAHYLLTLRDDKVADNMRYLSAFGYTRLPRHCEESLLLYARLTGKAADLDRFPIRDETNRRFEAFQRDLGALGGPGRPNNLKVRDALVAGYGDTYWFYALFGDTFFRPERPIATSRPREGS